MRVLPLSASCFKSGKIELDAISKKDLLNYDKIKQLAKKSSCDFLIEKMVSKYSPDYNVYSVMARRKWIDSEYIYAQEFTSVHKSTSLEDIAKKIYEATINASKTTTAKTMELAKAFIA